MESPLGTIGLSSKFTPKVAWSWCWPEDPQFLKIELFCLLVSIFLIVLYILDINLLSDARLMKIFSNAVYCFVLTVSFASKRFFSFIVSHLSVVDLGTWVIGVLFMKYSPMPLHSRLFPTISSIRFHVSRIMLRFLIYLNLSCVQCAKCGQPVRSVPFVQDAFVFVFFIVCF